MNDHENPEHPENPDLGALLTDAVADVEPSDRLAEIRTRTRHARRARFTWYTGGASLLAAAATVTAFAVLGAGDEGADPDPTTPTTLEDPVTGTTEVYYVGPGPDGPGATEEVLFRYAEAGSDPLALLMSTPSDPDYRTAWPEGSLVSYAVEGSQIAVVVGDDAPLDDEVARQQLVNTLQGVTGTDLPVGIQYADGREIAIDPIEPSFDLLSTISIDDPGEGAEVTGSLTVTGRVTGSGADVACFLYVGNDGGAYGPESATAEGSGGERLSPWSLTFDLADVPAGRYELSCSTGGAAGGTEGGGRGADTRMVVVGAADAPAPPPPGDAATTVYLLGPGPDGSNAPTNVLYRTPAAGLSDPIDALTDPSPDPDYRTLWPAGSLVAGGAPEDGLSVVELAPSAVERPPGMSDREAELAVQQIVYTLAAAYDDLVAVSFQVEGRPTDRVLGLPVDGEVGPEPELTVLSHLIIDRPADRATVGGSFTANGLANGFEGTVGCRLVDDLGGGSVWEGATIAGTGGARLFPWTLEVDLAGVAPGRYTFLCSTDDPTGGAEGSGAYTDTRTITVE